MPSQLLGEGVLPDGTTPEEMARNFLAELTGVFTLQDPETQLDLTRADSSRLGENFVVHVQFREILNSFPVFDSRVKVHISHGVSISHANAVACRLDNSVDFTGLVLTRDSAITLAVNAVPAGYVETESIKTDSGYVRQDGINVLAWRVYISTVDPGHAWRFTINQNGTILEIMDVAWYDTGLANVFFYHPDDGPTQEVSLENLAGSGYLIGTYADVTNIQFGRAFDADSDFRYETSDQHFEDASAYYHIDFAYQQICDLGFIYNGAIKGKVREYDCRPRYDPDTGEIILGRDIYGCQNQSWAADVIYHEAMHHATYYLAGLRPQGQEGAICEAISDYYACVWTDDPVHGEWVYPEPKRNLDNDYHYPEDYDPVDYHFSSQILSGTLWYIRDLTQEWWGNPMDDLVFEAMDRSKQEDTFSIFWQYLVLADRDLRHSEDLEEIYWGFQYSGIPAPANTNPDVADVFFIDSPDTIYEGESYWLRAVAQQDEHPEGQNLEYMWASLGTPEDFGFPYPSPPDTVAAWSAERQPGEVPPYERTIRTAVYDGLGGTDYFDLGPFLVYEQPCDCSVWGDVTGDGLINPLDVVYMTNYVYLGNDMRVQHANCPLEAGDVNCDGNVNPPDHVLYVNKVYLGNDMFCADPCTQ